MRALHGGAARASGVFSVRWSERRLARLLARLSGLPRPGEAVRVTLEVRPDERGETWLRSFDGRALVTRQWARDGLLAESWRGIELAFALEADGRGLRLVQRRAALSLGAWQLALPAVLAPRVGARVSGTEAPRVEVEVRLRGLGLLCRYGGALAIDSRS